MPRLTRTDVRLPPCPSSREDSVTPWRAARHGSTMGRDAPSKETVALGRPARPFRGGVRSPCMSKSRLRLCRASFACYRQPLMCFRAVARLSFVRLHAGLTILAELATALAVEVAV